MVEAYDVNEAREKAFNKLESDFAKANELLAGFGSIDFDRDPSQIKINLT